jgi:hypothetical protein
MIATKFNPLGLSNKPYDAEVEYLESTGTQWIDTGIYANEKTGVRIKMYAPQESDDWKTFFGGRNKTEDVHFQFQYQRSYCPNGRAIVGKKPNSSTLLNNTSIQGIHQWDYVVSGNVGILVVDGVERGTHTSVEPWSMDETITIFGGRMRGIVAEYAVGFSMYQVDILNESKVIQSLIPVRVGDVGYMYDKVSGKLFGNSGTGEFILGPDKKPANTTISAKSYVQDGLILHLDGIENVGYGKHESSPSGWKNLVGDNEMTFNAATSFDSNRALVRSAIGSITVNFQDQDLTIDIVATRMFNFSSTDAYYQDTTSNGSYNNIISYNRQIYYARQNFLSSFPESAIPQNIPSSIIVTVRSGLVTLYVNGVEILSEQKTAKTISVTYIRTSYTANNSQDIYSMRRYNRALTDEEIAHNYAVDKERFGL